jgi:adenosylhomocysteine nucleosidase
MNNIKKDGALLVFAMKEESQDIFFEHNVLHSGIGKVNAAYALTNALRLHKPPIVINMGTAGSRKHKGGSVISCTSFVQRDMDVTALGFEKFKTPFSDDPVIINHGIHVKDFPQGLCGSGDNFDASAGADHFDVVDMEAYALALICQRENIPFICLKYVSDGADGNAHKDWHAALRHTAQCLKEALGKASL